MAMNSTPRNPSPADAPAAPAAWNWATDLVHRQFALGSQGAAVMVRGFDAMRKIQDQATQQAVQRHTEAARGLGAPGRSIDAFAIQSELLRGDMEDAARCWQRLMGEALEVGNGLAACATRLVNTDDVFAAARLFHRPRD
jgi:hypothetical protein